MQRVLAYRYKDRDGKEREHFKNFVNLPDEAIERLGWDKGQELEWEVQGDLLLLKPVKPMRAVRRVELAKKMARPCQEKLSLNKSESE